jgi:hypothetical protein
MKEFDFQTTVDETRGEAEQSGTKELYKQV